MLKIMFTKIMFKAKILGILKNLKLIKKEIYYLKYK